MQRKGPEASLRPPARLRRHDRLRVRPGDGKAPEKQGISPVPMLLAISASDGSELARYPIAAAPVFNGMAAAGGELLIALENGQMLCMTEESEQ